MRAQQQNDDIHSSVFVYDTIENKAHKIKLIDIVCTGTLYETSMSNTIN